MLKIYSVLLLSISIAKACWPPVSSLRSDTPVEKYQILATLGIKHIFLAGNEIQDVSQLLLDINFEIEKKIQENNGFLSNLKGMVWKRSTDKDALAQLDEIHDALEPIFAKPCLAASDYATVKPLLKKAFTILHTSKDSQVVGQGMEFQKYLHKIINQNESGKVNVSVFNAKRKPIKDAKVLVNDHYVGNTNAAGQAQFEATSCTELHVVVDKSPKYEIFATDKLIHVPFSFEVELTEGPVGYAEDTTTDDKDDMWKSHIFAALPRDDSQACEEACSKNDRCDYYIFNAESQVEINCFFGDFSDSNPMEFTKSFLKGIVEVHKKIKEDEED